MKVDIKCKGSSMIALRDLIVIQGDLKELSEENYIKAKDSILELGFIAPFFIWKKKDKLNLIDGTQRTKVLECMRLEGIELPPKFPCVEVEAKSLKQAKKMILAISSNYGTMTTLGLEGFMGEIDMGLDDIAKSFTFDAIDFNIMGNEVPVEHIAPVEGEDDAPEVQPDPIAKRGDVWLLGEHRVMCGDSTMIDDVEKLVDGEKVDMVFTDPPYGVSFQSNHRSGTNKFDVLQNDDKFLDFLPCLEFASKDDSPWFIWTSHHVYCEWRDMYDDYYKSTIIWKKNGGAMGDLGGDYATNFEMALFCTKGKPKFINGRPMAIWEVGKDAASSYVHPTQKPVELSEYAMSHFIGENSAVLDLFLGSGSTLIACEKTNRKCYGMELDEKYVDVIIKRWQKFTDKEATLESTGQTYNELLKARDGEEKSTK